MTDDGASSWEPGPGWLFCPADRPERYGKALERSDQVILDLEDAVAPKRKALARDAVAALAAAGVLDRERTLLRLNGVASDEHALDLALVQSTGITRVMLAKSETAESVAGIPADVVLLCESPPGVERAGDLQRSTTLSLSCSAPTTSWPPWAAPEVEGQAVPSATSCAGPFSMPHGREGQRTAGPRWRVHGHSRPGRPCR